LQINLSFVDALIWDYTSPPTPTWNNIYEADINFNLPNNSIFAAKEAGKNRRGSSGHYRLHRSERLELFRKIEGLMDV
jgi:hypothetical protein